MTELREVFRNAIDLNRYSNSVSRRLIRAYNDAVLDAVDQLRGIDELASPVKAARLRSILAQLNDSLRSWSGESIATMTEELQGLAVLQSEFAVEQLQKALPAGTAATVGTVEISPALGQAIVSTEPTMAGVVNLSDSFERIARSPVTFQLTVGQEISLPNGEIVRTALEKMSARQAELFSVAVRNGLIEGQSVNAIVRRLKGRLTKEQRGSIDTIIAAGGQATSIPNNQIRAIVRTTVNQVATAADQIIAAENPDLTEKYRYTAVLDSRTSPICRALDGKVFVHGKGPLPPQHFNCRSVYVNIPIGLEREFREAREDYGEWLNKQDDATKRQVLGPERLALWKGMVKRFGPSDAIRKFVARDGSELTLDQLRKRGYGSASK
jgi:SPP1 gp7 family putative phage head morphogenesis protein|tara:strand:+ start:742 stop:1887 length:1146 start_codon:yes stop_codon:yes gene_type:complete